MLHHPLPRFCLIYNENTCKVLNITLMCNYKTYATIKLHCITVTVARQNIYNIILKKLYCTAESPLQLFVIVMQ